MDLAAEEWIKHALVEAERRRCISKVLCLESEPAVARGENYTSELFRLKVKVVDGNGELQERALIFKAMPSAVLRRWGIRHFGFFPKEAKVYQEVLTRLEELFKDCDGGENFWPELYAVRSYNEAYIMQDISVLGYKVLDRKIGLDSEHASLVLDALAKFHAGTCVLLERGNIGYADFIGFCFAQYKQLADRVYKMNLLQLADVLEHKWKGEWVDYAKRLRHFCESYFKQIEKAFKADFDSKFKVLTHGDLWTTNIMFKHDKDGKPVSLKIIDYQICFIGTPAYDLEYFFLSSLKQSEFHRKTELMESYRNSLERYLKQFGAMSAAPTMAELEECKKGLRIMSFLQGVVLKPIMLMPSDVAPDMDKITNEMAETMDFNNAEETTKAVFDYAYDGEDYVNCIKNALVSAKDDGLI